MTLSEIDFIQLESTHSTNSWAKEHASSFNPSHLTCITANQQTGGRGRQNKKWISPKDVNLYTSLYFVIPNGASYLANLGQIMALACAELFIEMSAPALIKWPNDLVVHQKKIGGILTETIPLQQETAVILGVGLNINMPEELLKTIDQPVTSLHLILQKTIEPHALLKPLLQRFVSYLTQLQLTGFASFQPRFQELLASKGEMVTVQLPQKQVQGICESITTEGCLRLKLPSGQFLTLSIGEILSLEN